MVEMQGTPRVHPPTLTEKQPSCRLQQCINSRTRHQQGYHSSPEILYYLVQECLPFIPEYLATCVEIMKPFVHAILPKLGFNRNTVRTIIYGSTRYRGFQLKH
eukprot:4911180-Ditylum_brightwellii.AAC.1